MLYSIDTVQKNGVLKFESSVLYNVILFGLTPSFNLYVIQRAFWSLDSVQLLLSTDPVELPNTLRRMELKMIRLAPLKPTCGAKAYSYCFYCLM